MVSRQKSPLVIASGAGTVKIFKVPTGPGGTYVAFSVEDYGTGKRRIRKFTAKLLLAAAPELVPALAIALFAGLRSAEVCRLK